MLYTEGQVGVVVENPFLTNATHIGSIAGGGTQRSWANICRLGHGEYIYLGDPRVDGTS